MAARGDVERRLSKVQKDIDSIISAITDGMYHASMKAKMDGLEAEKADLEARLIATPGPDPVAIHPGLTEIYARKVANLAEALNDPETKAEAADLLRSLIDKIVLRPEEGAPGGHAIELFGELGAILSLCEGDGPNATPAAAAGVRQVTVVAGTGYQRWLLFNPRPEYATAQELTLPCSFGQVIGPSHASLWKKPAQGITDGM